MIKSKIRTLCLSVVFAAGCVSTAEVSTQAKNPASSNVAAPAELSWQELSLPIDINFKFDEESQVLLDANSTGPVASFIIPVDNNPIDMALTSHVDNELTLYVPNILITNSKGEKLYHIKSNEFRYIPARLLDGDQVKTQFTIAPQVGTRQVNVLIYTTIEDLKGSTTIIHPAKALAIGKGNQPPNIPDLTATHSKYGQLSLTVSSASPTHQLPIRPTLNYEPANNAKHTDYLNSIQYSVEQGDMDHAITLLNEAEKLGIPNARATFINAVQNQSEQ
ncbi:MalM family protein [Photobacterium sp. OFAV2-7]|uniref:MalM family protein n=1 Tax=Photobacterium sp. OFAV2-7 TaxID=2917748 RepID=UPI001EF4B59A|nr:MalM family protein [Photobacterium sp. OFAV2-7]MCG7588475.1 MalM family protein [Photobacterium sp. OFAV2-7]